MLPVSRSVIVVWVVAALVGAAWGYLDVCRTHEHCSTVGAIEAAFPGTTADGKVDRQKLSARVVHDPAAMKQLEQITGRIGTLGSVTTSVVYSSPLPPRPLLPPG